MRSTFSTGKVLSRSCAEARVAKSAARLAASAIKLESESDIAILSRPGIRCSGWLSRHQGLRVGHHCRHQINLRIESFAEPAKQTHHAAYQKDIARNFHYWIGAQRARKFFRDFLQKFLVRVCFPVAQRVA